MTSESSSNKEKSLAELCEEIYKNSADDREKASMLITDLWKEITTDPEKHALYGSTISKYFERMEKSPSRKVIERLRGLWRLRF